MIIKRSLTRLRPCQRPVASVLALVFCATLACGARAQSSATNDGDAAHRADVARRDYLVNGSGVKVCVMSNSINDAAGSLARAQQGPSPAVPGSIDVLDARTGSGEGLGMLEIVHKIAPGASLGFAPTGPEQTMAQTIRTLAGPNHRCRIIVDDFSSISNMPFQDGARAIAINEVTAAGVLFVSAAGNFGNKKHGAVSTWEGDFKAGNQLPANWVAATNGRTKAGVFHTFDGQGYVTMTKPTTQIGLYWNDPWANPTEKYRLYVVRAGNLVAFSIDESPDVPRQALFPQVFSLTCPSWQGIAGAPSSCIDVGDRIYVVKEEVPGASGTRPSEPRFLRLDVFDGQIDIGTDGSTFGHSAAETVVTVAAANMPASGAFTAAATIADRSSDGPRRIFYKPDGTAITPGNYLKATDGGRELKKPDLAAAACATTVWPNFGNHVFCGTSAAAPHVAGIAALILSYRPNLTPAQVREILVASALDIETIPGWDDVSGYGIPMADKALALAATLQFGPKLGLLEKGGALETMRLNADRSVTNWPAAVKANAIANGIVMAAGGTAATLGRDGLRAVRCPNCSVAAAAPDLGMMITTDGRAFVYNVESYNALFQNSPRTDAVRDVVAGAGEPVTKHFYFLKRDGRVERWVWNDVRGADGNPHSLEFYKTLPVEDVVEISAMIGSLSLAMLRRDGTVETVDRTDSISEEMTDAGWPIVPRPPNVHDVVAIATGYAHVLALKKDGTVLAWGANPKLECVVPAGLRDVVSIAAQAHMSYALKRDGTVVTWGSPQ